MIQSLIQNLESYIHSPSFTLKLKINHDITLVVPYLKSHLTPLKSQIKSELQNQIFDAFIDQDYFNTFIMNNKSFKTYNIISKMISDLSHMQPPDPYDLKPHFTKLLHILKNPILDSLILKDNNLEIFE